MKQLLFRVAGITRKRRKKLQRRINSSTFPTITTVSTKAFAFLILGGVSLYQLGLALPEMTTSFLGSPSLFNALGRNMVFIRSKPFVGTSVLLIRDQSRSMEDKQTQLDEQIAKLKQGGIEVLDNNYAVSGLGVNTKSSDNLLGAIETALKSKGNSPVDTIYAFSDFEVVSSSNWSSDDEGYQRLEKLLKENQVRLYLGTVKNQPPRKLVIIARQSGGGLI